MISWEVMSVPVQEGELLPVQHGVIDIQMQNLASQGSVCTTVHSLSRTLCSSVLSTQNAPNPGLLPLAVVG